MDPSSIPPPPAPAPATNTLPMPTVPAAVPFPPEPNNHPPPAAPTPAPTHPPYAEMIYTAIEALKEKNGSSKRAIAKYIEQVYKDQLPPTHSALLTHHLSRLKNNGMLQMVKKSYMLPRSASAPAPSASPSGPSRPRGRPRKTQPQPQPQPAQVQPAQAQPAGNANILQQNAEPVWAALGLADEPLLQAGSEVKKRPGRPKKNAAAGGGTPQPGPVVATPGRRGRPPGSKSKKRPGRPPKPGSAAAAAAAAAPGWPKRRPGRPPKNQQQATPVTFAAAADPAAAVPALPVPAAVAVPAGPVPVAVSPRPRGRPKRNVYAAAMPAVVGATGRGRGRGRGRGGGGGRGGGRGRGRGRGRGGLSVQPRISTGRPVGRPRKGTIVAGTSQNVNNEDLRRKLEHFQSKVKESLAVLKPHFNHESPVIALAAIQELEELGTMDLNAPLRDETVPQQQQLPPQPLPVQQQQPPPPPPPQQQQLPPQQHMYQQQFPQFNLPPYQHQPQQYQHQHQHQPPQQQQLFHP